MPEPQTQVTPPAENPVCLLIIENNSNDVELYLGELKKAGLAASADVVETPEELTQRVRTKTYDLILAGHRLPNWNGTEAIPLPQKLGLNIPVIVVTGNLGEESAAECLRLGPSDLVLKDHLARLPMAVRRAVREEFLRHEALRAKEEMVRANETLSARMSELQRFINEASVLREMGDLLQACLTTEEAYHVICQTTEKLFPAEAGVLCVLNASRNLLEPVAIWGGFQPSEGVFAPEDCWALRRGRIQYLEDSQPGLVCQHLGSPPAPGSLCVPMMAQGESLGLLHLRWGAGAPAGVAERGAEARQLLAVTFAGRLALALA